MANPKVAESAAALRMLPSTDEVLSTAVARKLSAEFGQKKVTSIIRTALESVRRQLMEDLSRTPKREEVYSRESLLTETVETIELLWNEQQSSKIRRVINATGVVIHTNLGRAPLSDEAVTAVTEAAGYCTLEYDVRTGKRGRRGEYVENLIAEITGAEAALVVNNCAAAALLVLTVIAKGGEAIVSRGELVEIGGDFRVPDVLVQSGAKLREVGTTNRTKLSDYEKAISEDTRVVMRVHPSNYRIVGFTEKATLADLADLAHRNDLLCYEDAGSGALLDLSKYGLADEPLIADSIRDGADLITFSGDKLLGGSQAGIIVGRRHLIEKIRKHPMYRALRVDKLIYAALTATLESYSRGDAETSVPVLKMLSLDPNTLEERTREFAKRLSAAIASGTGAEITVITGESVVGGGSAPAVHPQTTLVALGHVTKSAVELEEGLRLGETPVIARIENGKVLVDLRTVRPDEEQKLLDKLRTVLA